MSTEENVKESEVAEEGSAIVQEGFDPSKFNDDNMGDNAPESSIKDNKESDEVETEEVSEEEVSEEESTEEEKQEDGESSYNTIENEVEENATENATENAVEEDTESKEVGGWKEIAEDIGINADTYEEFKSTLERQKELSVSGQTNEKIGFMKDMLSLTDEDLMRKEYEARKYNEEDIDDEIDIMVENNTLRSKARSVRRDIEAVIVNEQKAITEQPSDSESMTQEEIDESNRELKEYLSKTEDFFGGKVNDEQKDGHFTYIESGKFFEDITESAENVAQAAWLWRYKDQILKANITKAVEKGKSSILDNMTNPKNERSTPIPDPVSGEFNSSKFMEQEQM